jgi:uncharacterized alkaline shock family protein YloU
MPKTFDTPLGSISIAEEVIATAVGLIAMECDGLVSMASRRQVKDSLTELLGKENPGRGVEVRVLGDQTEVDLYIVVKYGSQIYEVAQNIRDRVRYVLSEDIGIDVYKVNIYVQGVRLASEH